MDDNELTAEEQAQLDAQRNATVETEPPAQTEAETPQEGAGEQEGQAEGEQAPPADKRPQMVPHAALHEERERRKEVERQAAEDRRKWEERYNVLLQKFGPPEEKPAQTDAIPDVQQDPVGHIVGTMRQLGSSQEQINQQLAQYRQQQEQAQVVATIQQRAVAQEAEYRAENPDYDNAITHLRQARDRELMALGITDPGQRQQQIMHEALGIAAMAMQQNGNVAERLYRLAEARGYAKAQAQPEAPLQPDPAAQIQRIAQGQQHARSLGNVRGTGPSQMNGNRLTEMSNKEFLEWMENASPADIRKFMGA